MYILAGGFLVRGLDVLCEFLLRETAKVKNCGKESAFSLMKSPAWGEVREFLGEG